MDLKYTTVLFDFDGTVIDSGPGILKSARAVISSFGFEIPPEQTLHKFIGPPLKMSFIETFNISPDLADEVVAAYRKQYKETKGILDAYIYQDMEDLLMQLNEAGATVAIASAKQERTVRETLRCFNLLQYFQAVAGAVPNSEYADKTEIMQDCLNRLNADIENTIMVGDTHYDAEGADAIGIDFCAALWGYGFKSIEDLQHYKCRYIAQDVPALNKFLLGE